jgi:3-hydroxybutyryl-CoA dehydrogenase
MDISKIGVVGCGVMGSGIAQISSQAGYTVVVSEVNDELLNRGLASIDSFLAGTVSRGKMKEEEKNAIINRINGTTKIEDLSDCQLIIESITEDFETKRKCFITLDELVSKSAILASNTSCLSIIPLAGVTRRIPQVLGIHFGNPVQLIPVVEIIKTVGTSEQTIEIANKFVQSLGKTTIMSKDVPGFTWNRIIIPMLLQAVRVLEDGLSSKEEIDQVMKLGCGHSIGPLASLDWAGLDTILKVADAMFDETNDSIWRAPRLMRQMVTAGLIGRKVGKGFYEY